METRLGIANHIPRVTVWLSFSGKAKVETGGPSLLTYDRLESDLYLWWA